MPKSSYLVRKMQAAERLRHDIRLDRELDDAMQLVQDAAFMAAADVFHMGPGRCEAFGVKIVEYVNEMAAIRKRDKENDPEYIYTREKVDQRLRQICGDKFQPWEVRYGKAGKPV